MKKALLFISMVVSVFATFSQTNIITTIAGCDTVGYSGDGGQATAAKLYGPAGLATDVYGNLYFADAGNNCIRKVDTNGIITTIAGNGLQGYSGDGGAAIGAEINMPEAVYIDDLQCIYIGDLNNCIRKVNTNGIISTIIGNGNGGYSGDGGAATNAKLTVPASLVVDHIGNIYFSDENNHCIRKVTTNGIINTIAGNGTSGYSGDGGPAINAQLNNPIGIYSDNLGNLYIADTHNDVVRMIDTNGVITTYAGNGVAGYSGDDGLAINAELNEPVSLTMDGFRNLYITDYYSSRVRMVNTNGIISTFAGNGTMGYTGDNGPATSASFFSTWGVVFNAPYDCVYIGDGNDVVRKVQLYTGEGNAIEQVKNSTTQINIYPNPSSTNFVIETNSTDKQTLQVFDINGKLVLTQTINGKANIDASNLAEGVYNLSLQNSNGVVNKRLVIVR